MARQGKAYWQARAEKFEGMYEMALADGVRSLERVRALEEREWHRYQGGDFPAVAMPAPGPDPDDGYEYHFDDTGLNVSRVKIPESAPE